MKYRAENQLELFEFHDSDFSLVSLCGEELTMSARHLNIHKATAQNPSAQDMEIARARIVFKGFRAPTYEPGRAWETDAEGNSHPVGPRVVFEGKEAEEKIVQELQKEFAVFDFGQKEEGRYYLDGCGIEPFFTMEFHFDSVLVEWEEYSQKAWYERYHQCKSEIKLDTPYGEETVEADIFFHEGDVVFQGKWVKDQLTTVKIRYDGQEFLGYGDDRLGVNAFASLQKQLPEGVSLKCCLTCRHGNMCPAGDEPGELFCTRDVRITQKNDLYFYTEDATEREKRRRQYTSICEAYQKQSDACYTYNDYPYALK